MLAESKRMSLEADKSSRRSLSKLKSTEINNKIKLVPKIQSLGKWKEEKWFP